MLTPEQSKNITFVYNRFLAAEVNGWAEIDNRLELLEFLSNREVYTESEALYSKHRDRKMGCPFKHNKGEYCTVLDIMEAVDSILQLYRETKELHPNNRYILCHYLALWDIGMIVEV